MRDFVTQVEMALDSGYRRDVISHWISSGFIPSVSEGGRKRVMVNDWEWWKSHYLSGLGLCEDLSEAEDDYIKSLRAEELCDGAKIQVDTVVSPCLASEKANEKRSATPWWKDFYPDQYGMRDDT